MFPSRRCAPSPRSSRGRDELRSRWEGRGEGQTHDRYRWLDLYPLTRMASFDAIRPLPASGARLHRVRCSGVHKSSSSVRFLLLAAVLAWSTGAVAEEAFVTNQ